MKNYRFLIALVIVGTLLSGCAARASVGELQTESKSIELGDANSAHVEITMGAGDLQVSGGTEKLMEANFDYNVARLKPEMSYTDGSIAVRQPDIKGLPALQGIAEFRNEWNLRFNNEIPMELSVDMGAGTSNLQLSNLSLTRLDLSLGAALSTVDLSGNWKHNLDVTIETGAADITVKLPSEVGVRVVVDSGPHLVEATGLTKDGNVYTNATYGSSVVTLQINLESGIGQIHLEVVEAPAANN